MFIKKETYDNMVKVNNDLHKYVLELEDKIKTLEDDSGHAVIKRVTDLAKEAKLDIHSEEYQTIMHRLFMDLAGRHSPVMKGYSQTSFIKDNPEEVLTRLNDMKKEMSVITRKIEKKGKK